VSPPAIGIRGIASSLVVKPLHREFPSAEPPKSRGPVPRVPSIDQRSRLNREIAIRDFKGYGTHASTNAEVRYPVGAWTCWCRRVKSLAPSLRSKDCRASAWDLTAQTRFLRDTVTVQYIFVPPLFISNLINVSFK
jgi:hypothetical protein